MSQPSRTAKRAAAQRRREREIARQSNRTVIGKKAGPQTAGGPSAAEPALIATCRQLSIWDLLDDKGPKRRPVRGVFERLLDMKNPPHMVFGSLHAPAQVVSCEDVHHALSNSVQLAWTTARIDGGGGREGGVPMDLDEPTVFAAEFFLNGALRECASACSDALLMDLELPPGEQRRMDDLRLLYAILCGAEKGSIRVHGDGDIRGAAPLPDGRALLKEYLLKM